MTKKELVDSMEEMKKDIKEIKKLLVGNGKVGMCEQIRILFQRQKIQWALIALVILSGGGAVTINWQTLSKLMSVM